jgi:hypothetical protein
VRILRQARLTEKLTKLKEEMGKLAAYEKQMLASPDQQISLTDPDSRSMPRPLPTPKPLSKTALNAAR